MRSNEFGNFFKKKRIASGVTQQEIADSLGYTTPQFISNWERGVSHPPIKKFKSLAEIIKCPADELFEAFLAATILEIKSDLTRKFDSSPKRIKVGSR